MKGVVAFAAGLLFAIGLGVGGMTVPAKVIAFLDVGGGHWDPSLAFVMGGALVVHLPFVRWRERGRTGVDAGSSAGVIDARLVAGAALFGIGWGLSGLCPGPAFVTLANGGTGIVVFVLAFAFASLGAQLVAARRFSR